MNRKLRLFVGIVVSNCAFSGVCATGPALPEATNPDATPSWVELSRYSGRSGSAPATPTDYRQLVYELQARRATLAPGAMSVRQRQPYAQVSAPRNNLRNRVPLSLIHWDRAIRQVTPEQERQALATGLATEPVTTNVTVFAVSPVRPKTYRGADLALSLGLDDLFEETADPGKAIVALAINTDDGLGWRELGVGDDIPVSYVTTGTKTIRMEAALADGTVLSASAPLEVAALAAPDPTETVPLSGGQLYLYKSGAHAGLHCPVFVVEGFDMNNDMDWDALYDLLNREQLAETLKSYGRDLVVLDFTDATADIFTNAAVAVSAITYVNAQRENPSDKFTVIGASMGGLVTRYALTDLERRASDYGPHGVATWISFDSPQNGANIPLGIQEFLSFFYNKNSDFESAAKLYNILNTPAAKQMLLVHSASTGALAGNPAHVAFQTAMDNAGYPNACKKVAISNGAGYGGTQPFSAGQRIIYWSDRSWDVDIDAYVYALSTNAPPAVQTVFYGFWDTAIPFDEVSTTKQRYYPYALDNASGGTRDSFKELFDNIQSTSRRGPSDSCTAPNHCFIPTVSSLGIDLAYSGYALHDSDSVKALSPFDEIHYAYNNEEHIEINGNNKPWFMRTILENYDSDGDGIDDYQEYLLGTGYSETNAVGFEQATVATSGEGRTGSGDYNAVASVFGIGPLALTVHVLPGSASAADYVAPSWPITLTWEAGEAGAKNVTIPIRGDRITEGPEVFYLALSLTEGAGIAGTTICTVTICDDDAGVVPDKGIFVAALPQSPEGGTVSGGAYCLPGKTVTLVAHANAGWTFLRWEDGSQAPSRTVSAEQAAAGAQNGVMLCTAFFKKTADLALPVCTNPGPQTPIVGLALDLPLTIASECLPSATVTGLPAGLRFDTNRVSVVGVPTATGTVTVTFTAWNPKGAAAPQVFTMQVNPLPPWAQGVFSGVAETDELGLGLASMSVTPLGAATGKLTLRGTNFAFSAASYASRDENGAFTLLATAKAGRASLPLRLALNAPEITAPDGVVPATLGKAEGSLGATGGITLYRNVWKDAGMPDAVKRFAGYYTAALSGGSAFGSGYLTLTVDPVGNVKGAGKLADGTAASLSGTLMLDEAGRVFTALYTVPKAYKGGGLAGLAEFVRGEAGTPTVLRLLDGAPLMWESLNPQATGDYGAGFRRETGLTGGWYNKVGNLYDYYRNTALSLGTDAGAPAPELTVGTNRYDSAWWRPEGVALRAVTNRFGVMTGLAAPKAGSPANPDKDRVWDYGATNTVRLALALKRETGVIKGTFRLWFDYEAKHTSKTVKFEGVLTPERDREDGVAGRGYFLWADKGYRAGTSGRLAPYSFNASYDLKVLESE